MTDILRNIGVMARRFKTATTMNMIGMALAFTVGYLLLSQIDYQMQYNHCIKDYERTYVLENNILSQEDNKLIPAIDWPAHEALTGRPEIESLGFTLHLWGMFSYRFMLGDSIVNYPYTEGNNTLMSTMTDQVIDGDIQWSDNDQEGIIIPASIAKQYFGTTEVAGKQMIRLNQRSPSGRDTLAIRGVYQDFPNNCIVKNSIVVNAKDRYVNDVGRITWVAIIRFKPGMTDITRFIESFKQSYKSIILNRMADAKIDDDFYNEDYYDSLIFRLIPIEQFYYDQSSKKSIGDKHMVPIMWLLFLLVIIIASINFMNFTLAESSIRVRNYSIRRVMGASRFSLGAGLVAECVIISVTACLLALLLCEALSANTTINGLFNDNIAINHHWHLGLFLILIAAIMGIITGIYPARFTTSFPLEMVQKRRFELTPQGNKFRRILICIQLSSAMAIIVFLGTLFTQYSYILTSGYGYDVKQILNVMLSDSFNDEETETAIRKDVLGIPGVENMAYSRSELSLRDSPMKNDGTVNGKKFTMEVFPVEHGFMRTMGIDIIEGRDFRPSDPPERCCIINESARKQWKWAEPGKSLTDDSLIVVGVCKNIRYATTRINNERPIVFWIENYDKEIMFQVRTSPDADQNATKRKIAEVVEQHRGMTPDYIKGMEEIINEAYFYEFRFMRQMLVYSIGSMLIMLIGVFCLTLFESEFRRKEIGIHKVVGASSFEIIKMLYSYYGNPILTSFVISIPLAYLMSKHWLNNFAEHASFPWWLFPLSLLLVGATTLGTVILQCWRTAHENPVNSIKDE